MNIHRDGLVSVTLHELLHVYWHILGLNKVFGKELEEQAIKAWEYNLFLYLQSPKRPHILESWVRAIDRKLNEC